MATYFAIRTTNTRTARLERILAVIHSAHAARKNESGAAIQSGKKTSLWVNTTLASGCCVSEKGSRIDSRHPTFVYLNAFAFLVSRDEMSTGVVGKGMKNLLAKN